MLDPKEVDALWLRANTVLERFVCGFFGTDSSKPDNLIIDDHFAGKVPKS